jgi:hypothetical protein
MRMNNTHQDTIALYILYDDISGPLDEDKLCACNMING